MPSRMPKHILLIATVGGSPKPLAVSIAHWCPDRVVFVPSSDTASGIAKINHELEIKEYTLNEGQFVKVTLSDPQDFSLCVQEMRSRLASDVTEWCGRGAEYGCVVDFTGGTKCMSAALALVARRWPESTFSYVGGEKRDRNNVGIVVSGSEQIVHSTNPWDALGYQVVEDAVAAFDRHAFGEGTRMLRNAMIRIHDDSSRKCELNALAMFMNAYDLWSRSEYGRAFKEFENCEKRLNDLAECLHPSPEKKCIRDYIKQAKSCLNSLKDGVDHPTRAMLEDLTSDAARCRFEGRHVDAVARLYRAVEATAQLQLWEEYKILTGKVTIDELPKSMRERLGKQSTGRVVKLGLQDSYELLIQKQDPLGKRFELLGWNSDKSPLSKRNDSIAGHGFARVSSETSDELWKGTLMLAGISENDVFRFPRLGQQDEKYPRNP